MDNKSICGLRTREEDGGEAMEDEGERGGGGSVLPNNLPSTLPPTPSLKRPLISNYFPVLTVIWTILQRDVCLDGEQGEECVGAVRRRMRMRRKKRQQSTGALGRVSECYGVQQTATAIQQSNPSPSDPAS